MAGDFNIGAGITLDGEADFKKAVQNINKEMNVLGSEFKKVSAQFSDTADSMEALSAKHDVLGRKADEQRSKIQTLTAALENAKQEYGENSDKVKDWQIKLNNAEADLAKTESQIRQTANQMENFGNETEEAGKHMESAEKRTLSFGDVLKANILGAGIVEGIRFIASAISGLASSALDAADSIQKQADITGLSAERLQELQYAGNNLGVSLDTVTGAQAKLTKSMSAARDGTGTQAEAFKKLGISVTESNGQLKSATDVMSEAFTALNGVSNETERDALAMQIFGKSAMELNPMIKAGGDELNRLTEEARNNGAVMSGEAVAGLDTFGDTMDNVKTAIMGSIGQGLSAIAPIVTEIVTAFVNFTRGVDGAEKSLSESVTKMVQKVTEKMPEFITLGVEIIAAMATGIIQNIPLIVSKIPMIVFEIVKALVGLYSKLVDTGLSMIGKLAAGIASGAKSLWEKASEIGKNVVDGVWAGIKNAKDWLVGKVKEWCGSILNGIKSFFGIHSPSRVMRDQVGVMLARGVADGIDNGVVFAQESAKKMGEAIVGELSNLNEQLAKAETDTAKAGLQEKIKALEQFKRDYESALSELERKQQGMASKVSDYGKLFEKAKTDDGKELFKLGDLQQDIDKIKEYGNALDDLKSRGADESLLAEISSMNIDDAVGYTKLLLEKTPEQYDEYMTLWKEKQTLAADVAKQFYMDEFSQLQTEFVDKVPTELGKLKTEMEGIGKNSALGLADGFWSKKSYIVSTFKSVLEAALQEAKASMEIHSPSRKWAEVGKFMAEGLGVGFTGQMNSVARQINQSIPTIADPMLQTNRAVEGMVNGLAPMFSMSQAQSGQPIILQTFLDGRMVAQSVYDPLRDLSRQKGVSLA